VTLQVPLTVRLHAEDNVVVALADILPGTRIPEEGMTAAAHVPAGHKIASRVIAGDARVLRYGQIIGFATQAIAPGDHVHTQNCEIRDFSRDYAFCADQRATAFVDRAASFQGIRREDGRVATRNYIGILTSVNCSAGVARAIADHFRPNPLTGQGPLSDFPNIDGVVALTHKTGCGMASEGEPVELLRRTIAGYARHPNFAAVLLIGLGCEANQVARVMRSERLEDSEMLQTLVIQQSGGTKATILDGIKRITALLPRANKAAREPLPASHITVGLQCGGSDGFSGLTANPALGVASDLLVRHGGSVILSETTEIYGAEHLLTRRAARREIGEKLVGIIKWWEDYTARHHGSMDNNPSPGNKAGGLTTILEKSLGAVAKAGSTNLVDVVRYGEAPQAKGLVFMDAPGFDPVSATGQVASGANVICFTTGRGSAFGCKPVPSIKLSTNTALYRRMPDDMDLDCGSILAGERVEDCGRRIFEMILRVASGEQPKSEQMGFGEDEFAPWPLGAVV